MEGSLIGLQAAAPRYPALIPHLEWLMAVFTGMAGFSNPIYKILREDISVTNSPQVSHLDTKIAVLIRLKSRAAHHEVQRCRPAPARYEENEIF